MTINYEDDNALVYVYSPKTKVKKKRNCKLGDLKRKFIKLYTDNLNISETLYELHLSRPTFNRICEADEQFKDEIQIVKEGAIARLEDKVIELCEAGNEKILTWYLTRLDPDRFSSKQNEINIEGGKVEFKLNLNTDE